MWCEDHGIRVDIKGKLVSLHYPANEQRCLQLAITDGAPALVAMAHGALLQDLVDPDPQDFAGALIWLRDWDIWSESFERTGIRMLETLRRQATGVESSSIRDTPAHVFGPQEFADAHALLMIPFMFQWDAYVVPASGRCFVFVSHHAHVRITAATEAINSRIAERFGSDGWSECSPD
jgi:hypothetical protein